MYACMYVVEGCFAAGRGTNKKKDSEVKQSNLFAVLDAQLTAGLDALQDVLAVLVELELLDDDLAGVDAEGNALAGGLVAGDTLDVDLVLEAVDRSDLALAALVGAPHDLDLVVLANGDATDLWVGENVDVSPLHIPYPWQV